jgi:hypothetical protein
MNEEKILKLVLRFHKLLDLYDGGEIERDQLINKVTEIYKELTGI